MTRQTRLMVIKERRHIVSRFYTRTVKLSRFFYKARDHSCEETTQKEGLLLGLRITRRSNTWVKSYVSPSSHVGLCQRRGTDFHFWGLALKRALERIGIEQYKGVSYLWKPTRPFMLRLGSLPASSTTIFEVPPIMPGQSYVLAMPA